MKKQVLIFGHGYNPPFVDVYNQYSALFNKDIYDVTLLYLAGEENEIVKQKSQANKIIFLQKQKRKSNGLKLSVVKEITQLCRAKNFTIVICHRYKPTYIMALVSQFVRIPTLISVMHALDTLQSTMRRWFLYLFGRHILLAGVSNAVREDILTTAKRLNPKQVIVLPNAIDIDAAEKQLVDKNTARQQFNLANTDYVFGTIGRLHPHKDQASLIKAFAQVRQQYPAAKLMIMGDGKLAISLKELTQQLNLTDNVIFTGFVPDAYRWLKAFDVFVLSSLQETFGRVLLEAMVAKIPFIATNIHGIPEVAGDAGILVPARDPQSLATAMIQTLHMSAAERQQQGERGYQHTAKNFSLQKFKEVFWETLDGSS